MIFSYTKHNITQTKLCTRYWDINYSTHSIELNRLKYVCIISYSLQIIQYSFPTDFLIKEQ